MRINPVQRSTVKSNPTTLKPFTAKQQNFELYFSGTKARPEGVKRKLLNGSFFASPFLALTGGLALATSALLPGENTPNNQIDTIQSVSPINPQSTDEAEQRINELKDLLKALGWGMISVSTLADAYTAFGGAVQTKQPSLAASAIVQAGVSPFLYLNQSISSLGILYAAYGLFYSGFSNEVYNNHNKPEGEDPRELDLRPMLSPKALKAMVGDESNPNFIKLAKEWGKYTGQVTGFIAQDQLNVAKSLVPKIKKSKGIDAKNTENAEKPKESLWQKALKPSTRSTQITSALAYAGGLPLIFVSGPQTKVAEIAAKCYTAGHLSESKSFLALGKEESGWESKALLVGVPVSLVGTVMVNSNLDLGTGLYMTGMSSILNYMAFLALPDDETPNTEAIDQALSVAKTMPTETN